MEYGKRGKEVQPPSRELVVAGVPAAKVALTVKLAELARIALKFRLSA